MHSVYSMHPCWMESLFFLNSLPQIWLQRFDPCIPIVNIHFQKMKSTLKHKSALLAILTQTTTWGGAFGRTIVLAIQLSFSFCNSFFPIVILHGYNFNISVLSSFIYRYCLQQRHSSSDHLSCQQLPEWHRQTRQSFSMGESVGLIKWSV